MRTILALLVLLSFLTVIHSARVSCLKNMNVLDFENIESFFDQEEEIHAQPMDTTLSVEENLLSFGNFRKGFSGIVKKITKIAKKSIISKPKKLFRAPVRFVKKVSFPKTSHFTKRIVKTFRKGNFNMVSAGKKIVSKTSKTFRSVAQKARKGISTISSGSTRAWKLARKGIQQGFEETKKGIKKGWNEVKKISKFHLKFKSLLDAVLAAKKKLTGVSKSIINYIGPLKRGKCSNQLVCQFQCHSLVNCPVKIKENSDFMDLTQRIKANDEERKSYNWVCKNSIFSGKSQKDSTLSKLFRRIVNSVTKLGENQFESVTKNINVVHYDIQYLNWIKKALSGEAKVDVEILYILNDYKEGLAGFTKICKEIPDWTNQIEVKLKEFESDSISNSETNGLGDTIDMTASAFKKMRDYLSKHATNGSPDSRYRYELLQGLFRVMRSEYVEVLKGIKEEQEYCACTDYGRFFTSLEKLPIGTRQKYYGVGDLTFESFYMDNIKSVCNQRCNDAMKSNGYSEEQIQLNLKNTALKIQLNPGDKKVKKFVEFGSDNKKRFSEQVETSDDGTSAEISRGTQKVSKKLIRKSSTRSTRKYSKKLTKHQLLKERKSKDVKKNGKSIKSTRRIIKQTSKCGNENILEIESVESSRKPTRTDSKMIINQ
jgi:hypothetical protein